MRRTTIYLSVCICVGLLTAMPRANAWSVSSLLHEAVHYLQHMGHDLREKATGPLSPRRDALPNPSLTPGALNPMVTQATLYRTICRPGGYSRALRPSEEYTERLKRQQIRQYGYRDHRLGAYEEDHLVPIGLGGSPDSPRNLWPQPHNVEGGWGSYAKDTLERRLHELVCSNRISLAAAQYAISDNWIAAYKRYVAAKP